ncbi:hypothetical protein AAG570_009696 [Ranatra chinensis]|uniref:Protein THEM6 n=1 Tax=Ranatra chinensis TaxID=642074 RepID=A0ABD0YPV3_9HEMI
MWCVAAVCALLLLVFVEVSYFLRIVLSIAYGRLFEKRGKVTDPTVIYGFCFTQDLDIAFKHMNNARFVRELDFARFHFYDRTGLYSEMLKNKTDAFQVATNIRYRRVIPFLTPYKIVTQLIYWDDRSIYLEQKFITNDGFVRAVVLSKQTVVKVNVEDVMKTLKAAEKPPLEEDLDLWLKSINASSEKMKSHAS